MMLDWNVVLAAMPQVGCSERLFWVATRPGRGEWVLVQSLDRLQREGAMALPMHIGDVLIHVVVHAYQRRRVPGDLRLFGDNESDRLVAEEDPVVVKWTERRTFRRNIVL
jgi:hypothetical protein